MAYLDDHPNPHLAQQRPRRDHASGVFVVHTAESMLDVIGDDSGAEGVANYIAVRTSYGSYHRIADSDSVVAIARFEMTTYGDGTGSNDHAIHISFACRASDWPGMSADRKAAFIRNGARAAAEAAAWLKETRGITVPARRITRAQSDQKVPGFISHGERDPGRRTDPGPEFPWDQFMGEYESLTDPQEDISIMDAKTKDYLDRQFARSRQQVTTVKKATKAMAGALDVLADTVARGDDQIKARVTKSKRELAEAIADLDQVDDDQPVEDA